MVCRWKIKSYSMDFGCSYRCRVIGQNLEFELHFFACIIAHFCIHVPYIHMINKILGQPPLFVTNLTSQWTQERHIWCTRCTGECILITLFMLKECLAWCFIVVGFRILNWLVDKHWQKCHPQPLENQRILQRIVWPYIVTLLRNIIANVCNSQHCWTAWQPTAIYPPCFWSTFWSVLFHNGIQLCFLFLSWLGINNCRLSDDSLIEADSNIFRTLYYRDIFKHTLFLLAYCPIQVRLDLDPVHIAETEWHDLCSEMNIRDWLRDTQNQHPARVKILPVIPACNKACLANMSGNQHIWPLIVTIGKIQNTICHTSKQSIWTLIKPISYPLKAAK